MGKQIKKIRPEPKHPHEKICERCGNGGITRKKQFRCMYCGWMNGVGSEQYDVEITSGGLEK